MENLARPEPVRSVADRVREWVGWFGLGRLVAAAVAVVVVCTGAFWLVRTPPPPTEASLPMATAVPNAATTPTLPPPEAAPADAAQPSTLTVHVAGAVASPGVYTVPAGSRVNDAIALAGGVSADGLSDALNLAAVVVDGTRIYVPTIGEAVVSLPIVDGASASSTPSGPLDVNRATASELDALPGVGPATAAAIVTERERSGPFLSVDDLDRVPGIGPAKLAALRDLVTT